MKHLVEFPNRISARWTTRGQSRPCAYRQLIQLIDTTLKLRYISRLTECHMCVLYHSNHGCC